MDDADFQNTAFPILAREIFDAVRAQAPIHFGAKKNRTTGAGGV